MLKICLIYIHIYVLMNDFNVNILNFFRAITRYIKVLWIIRSHERKNRSIADVFRQHVSRHPNKVCFIFEDQEWTYQQVNFIKILNHSSSKRNSKISVNINVVYSVSLLSSFFLISIWQLLYYFIIIIILYILIFGTIEFHFQFSFFSYLLIILYNNTICYLTN